METLNLHPKCAVSTGIDGSITAGFGMLDDYGFWEYPCQECQVKAQRVYDLTKENKSKFDDQSPSYYLINCAPYICIIFYTLGEWRCNFYYNPQSAAMHVSLGNFSRRDPFHGK